MKKMKFLIPAFALVALTFAGCSDDGDDQPEDVTSPNGALEIPLVLGAEILRHHHAEPAGNAGNKADHQKTDRTRATYRRERIE